MNQQQVLAVSCNGYIFKFALSCKKGYSHWISSRVSSTHQATLEGVWEQMLSTLEYRCTFKVFKIVFDRSRNSSKKKPLQVHPFDKILFKLGVNDCFKRKTQKLWREMVLFKILHDIGNLKTVEFHQIPHFYDISFTDLVVSLPLTEDAFKLIFYAYASRMHFLQMSCNWLTFCRVSNVCPINKD